MHALRKCYVLESHEPNPYFRYTLLRACSVPTIGSDQQTVSIPKSRNRLRPTKQGAPCYSHANESTLPKSAGGVVGRLHFWRIRVSGIKARRSCTDLCFGLCTSYGLRISLQRGWIRGECSMYYQLIQNQLKKSICDKPVVAHTVKTV